MLVISRPIPKNMALRMAWRLNHCAWPQRWTTGSEKIWLPDHWLHHVAANDRACSAGGRWPIALPRLDLAPRVREAQEPKCIQAFLPDAAVETLRQGSVGRLA